MYLSKVVSGEATTRRKYLDEVERIAFAWLTDKNPELRSNI